MVLPKKRKKKDNYDVVFFFEKNCPGSFQTLVNFCFQGPILVQTKFLGVPIPPASQWRIPVIAQVERGDKSKACVHLCVAWLNCSSLILHCGQRSHPFYVVELWWHGIAVSKASIYLFEWWCSIGVSTPCSWKIKWASPPVAPPAASGPLPAPPSCFRLSRIPACGRWRCRWHSFDHKTL